MKSLVDVFDPASGIPLSLLTPRSRETAEVRLAKPWLVGGGRTGGTIRRHVAWAETPLGPLADWPQSLRTLVGACLGASVPMAVVWGPEQVMLYNDAYLPLVGEAHPLAMGRGFAVRWESHWAALDEAFRHAGEGDSTSVAGQRVFTVRDGRVQEQFFTFAFGPAFDERRAIGGVVHTCLETTAEHLALRRARSLRELDLRLGAATGDDEIHQATIATLAAAPDDVPFARLYRFEPTGPVLAASTGVVAAEGRWPLDLVARTGQALQIHAPDAAAVALPIQLPADDRPSAALIAGISPRLDWDEAYREHLGAIALRVTLAAARARVRRPAAGAAPSP